MGYATESDITKQLPEGDLVQLTDDAGAGVVDQAVLAAALEDADTEIDGYLGSRYPLPLANPPAILNKQAVDIVIYNLYGRRGGPPEHIAARYKNAIAFLSKVAEGKISLGAGDPDGTGTSAAPQVVSATRIFSREKLKGF